jgi:ubiquinone/menaquinone biosynthesis C-methylase UbiE
MSNVNERILGIIDFVRDCYEAQTRAFSAFEYDYLRELILKNKIASALDVGTGEGNFISGLARLTPDVKYKAVDADPELISSAREKHNAPNLSFEQKLFDHCFPYGNFDLITARFAVEHMKNVPEFVSDAFTKLRSGGILMITEYFIDTSYAGNSTWKLFRDKELKFYHNIGSHPRISLALPKFLKDQGFSGVESVLRHVSPSTVGHTDFYNVIRSYANLYSAVEPDLWTDVLKRQILDYCDKAHIEITGLEDVLFVSQTLGKRP